MNIDQPDARTLLETARRILNEDILPEVDSGRALDIRMIIRVIEIAGRTLGDSSDGLGRRQRSRLDTLIGEAGDVASLANGIRSGAFDQPDAAHTLHATLTEDARDRLGRLNPRYLARVEAED
jgi:hypothetical protein